MKQWVVIDFETASSCDLKQCGAARYAEDLSTEILCLAYSVGGEDAAVAWCPGRDRSQLLALANDPETIFIAHNVSFEKAIWRNIMVLDFGFPDIKNSRWHDTMAVAAHKALPQELETLVNVLGLAQKKDMEGRKVTLGMSKPDKDGNYDRSPEKRARAALYCQQDIAAEVAVHKRLGWLPPTERSVWLLNQRINERGLRLDLDFVRAAQKVVDDASKPLLKEFAALTGGPIVYKGAGKKPKKVSGGLEVTQSVAFLKWLHTQGVHIDNLQKETVAEYIGDIELVEDDDLPDDAEPKLDLFAPAHRALRIRQLVGSASVKKLKRMEACVSMDGRARGLSQYHGSAPGRNTGRLLQPYNFPRGTVKVSGKAPPPQMMVDAIMTEDYEYVEDVCGTGAVEAVVSSLRHALVPNPGRVFLSGDYAGIQARVVLAVARQLDKLDLFSDDRLNKKGEDIYLDMAAEIFKRVCTADDKVERQAGKNSVLGLGFQMGAKKFRFKYAKTDTLAFCERIVQTYRKEWAPLVPGVWYGLSKAAVKCVHTGQQTESHGIEYAMEGDAMSARLPSGRKIWYQYPKAQLEPMPWDESDLRMGFRYHVMKMGQWKEVKAFGGLLTENVVMGIEVDIQRRAQQLCEKNGFPVVLEVYDEVVVEPEVVNADEKAFKQILLDVEPWVDELKIPIAVECWSGNRYKK
jgi:DNA polymerase